MDIEPPFKKGDHVRYTGRTQGGIANGEAYVCTGCREGQWFFDWIVGLEGIDDGAVVWNAGAFEPALTTRADDIETYVENQ